MPEEIFTGATNVMALRDWRAAASSALLKHGRAMLAIGRASRIQSSVAPHELIAHLIDTTTHVLGSQPVERIFLEGGATAAALLHRMNWVRLRALATGLIGVAVLRAESGQLLFIKPGSYPWPAAGIGIR